MPWHWPWSHDVGTQIKSRHCNDLLTYQRWGQYMVPTFSDWQISLIFGLSKERPILDHHAKAHIHEIRRISHLKSSGFYTWNPLDFMGEIRQISRVKSGWNPPDFERPIARNGKPYVSPDFSSISFPFSCIFFSVLYLNDFNKCRNLFNKYTPIKNQRKTKNENVLNSLTFSSILGKITPFPVFWVHSLNFPVCSKFCNFSLTGKSFPIFQVFQSMWEPCNRSICSKVIAWKQRQTDRHV